MENLKKLKKYVASLFSCTRPKTLDDYNIKPKSFAFEHLKERDPWKRIVRGTCCQADPEFAPYSNTQCTSMAVTAAMYNSMKCVNKWSQDDIDLIIHQGDDNHFRFRNKYLYSNSEDKRVALDEIPKTFTIAIKEQKAVGRQINEWAGPVSYTNPDFDKSCQSSCPSLIDVLAIHLKANRPIVATINELTVLFMKVGSEIWLFDSHERDMHGRFLCKQDDDGKAFAVPFSTLYQLERYLISVYRTRSIFYATSLKIWIPDEHISEHQRVLRRVERRLLLIVMQKLEFLNIQRKNAEKVKRARAKESGLKQDLTDEKAKEPDPNQLLEDERAKGSGHVKDFGDEKAKALGPIGFGDEKANESGSRQDFGDETAKESGPKQDLGHEKAKKRKESDPKQDLDDKKTKESDPKQNFEDKKAKKFDLKQDLGKEKAKKAKCSGSMQGVKYEKTRRAKESGYKQDLGDKKTKTFPKQNFGNKKVKEAKEAGPKQDLRKERAQKTKKSGSKQSLRNEKEKGYCHKQDLEDSKEKEKKAKEPSPKQDTRNEKAKNEKGSTTKKNLGQGQDKG